MRRALVLAALLAHAAIARADAPEPVVALSGGATMWPDSYGPVLQARVRVHSGIDLELRGTAGDSNIVDRAIVLQAYATLGARARVAWVLETPDLSLAMHVRAGLVAARLFTSSLTTPTVPGGEVGASLESWLWGRIGLSLGMSAVAVRTGDPQQPVGVYPAFEVLASIGLGASPAGVSPMRDWFVQGGLAVMPSSAGLQLSAGFERDPVGLELTAGASGSIEGARSWLFAGPRLVWWERPGSYGHLRLSGTIGIGTLETIDHGLGGRLGLGLEWRGGPVTVALRPALMGAYEQQRFAKRAALALVPAVSLEFGYASPRIP